MMTVLYYWVGAHDVGNKDTYVWVGTGDVLPDNSTLWQAGHPVHRARNCVGLWRRNGKLYDEGCYMITYFICEA